MKKLPTPIAQFLERYKKEYDFYDSLARMCQARCQMLLDASGIRGIVTSRAKRLDTLHRKLLKRHKAKPYRRTDTIYRDIVDLAGVRLALYFPADRAEVSELIQNAFIVEKVKEFPESTEPRSDGYHKRFKGYVATHFRVRLREEDLAEDLKRYAQAQIEIQIASVLMHAWAEVEHDLVYKPATGQISRQEQAILDELNGMVLTGEIALERLQEAVKDRVSADEQEFNNHYELAAFLHGVFKPRSHDHEPVMGRADVLFKALEILSLNSPKALRPYLEELEPATDGRSIAERLIDDVIAGDPERYKAYRKAQELAGSRNPYSTSDDIAPAGQEATPFQAFMSRWIALEAGLNVGSPPSKRNPRWQLTAYLDEADLQRFMWLQRLRSQIVHGVEIPEPETLTEATQWLDRVMRVVLGSAPPNVKDRIEETLRRLNARPQERRLGENGGAAASA